MKPAFATGRIRVKESTCTPSHFSVPHQRVTLDPETSKCPHPQKRNAETRRQTRGNPRRSRARARGQGGKGVVARGGREDWRSGIGRQPWVPGGGGRDPESKGPNQGFPVKSKSMAGEGGKRREWDIGIVNPGQKRGGALRGRHRGLRGLGGRHARWGAANTQAEETTVSSG